MSARLLRPALTALLCASLVAPAPAGAQNDAVAFPSVGDGRWEGLVHFYGYTSSDSEASDGSFTTSVTDVIDDTVISLDLVVSDDGEVTSGTMKVDLTWFRESVGTTPINFEPFRVVTDNHQTGTLEITGNAERLVASGTLTHTVNTATEGGIVEEVSGTETEAVEWVFRAVEVTCVRVALELIEASGLSLMATALFPRATVRDYGTIYIELVSQMLVWPADVEDPERIRDAIEELTKMVVEVHGIGLPEVKEVQALVKAWSDLNAELARLDECQTALVGSVPASERSWLVDVLQSAINKALDNSDDYDARELFDLWDAGLHEQALDIEMRLRFFDVFNVKLDEAIAGDDIETIITILALASAYGIETLYDKARANL